MLVFRLAIANAASGELIITRRACIKVASFQNEGDEIPRMIMVVIHGLAFHEVVDPDGEEPQIEHPAFCVGA